MRRESKAEPEPEPEPEPEVEEEEDTGGMCVAPNLTAPATDECVPPPPPCLSVPPVCPALSVCAFLRVPAHAD